MKNAECRMQNAPKESLQEKMQNADEVMSEYCPGYYFMQIKLNENIYPLPVYNTAEYLSACMESILNQSEKDWELIAVDDFSEDKSFQLLKSYSEKDKRIKCFRNEKKGIAPALQLAFQNSTGQLITRMDSDDIMLPNKLEILKRDLLIMVKEILRWDRWNIFRKMGWEKGIKNTPIGLMGWWKKELVFLKYTRSVWFLHPAGCV